MNEMVSISAETFQEAWAKVVGELQINNWHVWSLIVQINSPLVIEKAFHDKMNIFAQSHKLISQEQVAYTIFPYKLYHPGMTRENLYRNYRRYFQMYDLNKYSRWGGTYFDRMINYQVNGEVIDQLGTIIDGINGRQINYGASYVMVIPYPNKDVKRIMGAPCLNYITVQVDDYEGEKYINMCAVYRNHDFRVRAYGNYMGLGKLMQYIALETHAKVGRLTCLSSRAYIDANRKELINIAGEFWENGNI